MENIKAPTQVLVDLAQELEQKIAIVNEQIKADKLTVKAMDDVSKAEKKYATQMEIIVFSELKKSASSKIDAIKKLTYNILGHSFETEIIEGSKEKKVIGLKTVERMRYIDLLKFCDKAGLDKTWSYNVSALGQSLALYTALKLKYSKKELDDMAKTYYLQEKVKDIANGKTPTSNRQLCKLVQACADAILPPEIEGKSQYKINNHHLAFILEGYTKLGKKPLSIKVAHDATVRNLLLQVLHEILCGTRFTVDYRMEKNAVAPVLYQDNKIDDTKDNFSLSDLEIDTSIFDEEDESCLLPEVISA